MSERSIVLLQAIVDDLLAGQMPDAGRGRWPLGGLRVARDELRAEYLACGGTGPRARHAVARPDVRGHDLRPDPLGVVTLTEFMATVRAFRAWAGQPSWRAMAKTAGGTISYTAIYSALNGNSKPTLPVVLAAIKGCDGSQADLDRFATAWRQVTMGRRARLAIAPAS